MATDNDFAAGADRHILDNRAQEAGRRLAGLSKVFDPGTFRLLAERGVAAGWRCLEVGAGSGSVAAWLADRVGPTGTVLATDIEPRFSDAHRRHNIELSRHNIAADPLPEAAFDIVHARLLLILLPEREKVLARMVAALKPGGWILTEDFDAQAMRPDPEIDSTEKPLQSLQAMRRVMESNGFDLRCGRRTAAMMLSHGLQAIGAEARAFRWRGGSAGAGINWANLQQMRAPILATGLVDEPELEADLARLDDPQFAFPSPLMWATWGQRAA